MLGQSGEVRYVSIKQYQATWYGARVLVKIMKQVLCHDHVAYFLCPLCDGRCIFLFIVTRYVSHV